MNSYDKALDAICRVLKSTKYVAVGMLVLGGYFFGEVAVQIWVVGAIVGLIDWVDRVEDRIAKLEGPWIPLGPSKEPTKTGQTVEDYLKS